jgi:4-hydroxyacetophenone monooxygenase
VRYIVDLIGTMAREGLGAMECTPEVEQDYVRRHDDAHSRMIWTHDGMDNWYRNNAGRVVTGSVVGGGLLGRYRDPCRTAVTAVP